MNEYEMGRMARKNPAILKMYMDSINAERAAQAARMGYGQAATPQETAPFEQDMMEGEQPIPGLMNITQEAQPGSGLIGRAMDAGNQREADYLQMQKDMTYGGVGGMKQQAQLLNSMQNSVMSNQGAMNRNTADNQTSRANNWNTVDGAMRRQLQEQQYNQTNPQEDYNAKIAQAEWYMGLPENQQERAREAWRAQKVIDQGTQFQDVSSGRIIPKFNTEAAKQTAAGKTSGTTMVNTLAEYGSERAAEAAFMDDLTSTKALIGKTIPQVSGWNTGWGSLLSAIPATDASAMKTQVNTIKARLGIDKLMEMKTSSNTGASGLGALSQKELEVITGYLQTIERSDKPSVVRHNFANLVNELDRIEKRYKAKRVSSDKRYNTLLGELPQGSSMGLKPINFDPVPQQQQQAPPPGADPAFDAYMRSKGL